MGALKVKSIAGRPHERARAPRGTAASLLTAEW
jgi:hypothetical protein